MTYRCYNQVVDKVFGNKLAKILTKVGIILTKSGAEVHRVEDTMERICKAYGASVIDAYVTPTLLIISFSFKDQSELYPQSGRRPEPDPGFRAAVCGCFFRSE